MLDSAEELRENVKVDRSSMANSLAEDFSSLIDWGAVEIGVRGSEVSSVWAAYLSCSTSASFVKWPNKLRSLGLGFV